MRFIVYFKNIYCNIIRNIVKIAKFFEIFLFKIQMSFFFIYTQVSCPKDPIQNFWVQVQSSKGVSSFPYQNEDWYQVCVSGFEYFVLNVTISFFCLIFNFWNGINFE